MKYKTKDSGKRQDYDSGMRRDTQEGKPRYDLCYLPLFKRWAELMERGAEKYGANNWQLADSDEEMERFKASAFRHFMQWTMDDVDEDHAAAVLFNIAAVEYLKDKMNPTSDDTLSPPPELEPRAYSSNQNLER